MPPYDPVTAEEKFVIRQGPTPAFFRVTLEKKSTSTGFASLNVMWRGRPQFAVSRQIRELLWRCAKPVTHNLGWMKGWEAGPIGERSGES
jgi:hypothetical protein